MDRSQLLLVTGASGLVGSHVVEKAVAAGLRVRAIVREASDISFLQSFDVELVQADLQNGNLTGALEGVTHVVHCAAKVGDWGPVEEYRSINVAGLQNLLDAAIASGSLQRFVHMSSLGVYEARHHYGTDESEPPHKKGIDGYTLTKVEAEELVQAYVRNHQLPAVLLRPGFIYGPRDRTVLPKLLRRLKLGKFAYLGRGDQLLNNVYVGNVTEAVFLALSRTCRAGDVFNLTDDRLITRTEMIEAICSHAALPIPKRHVPLPVARFLAGRMESAYRFIGAKEAPILSQARIKFLGLHLDFNCDRARHHLGYQAATDFRDGIATTMDWAKTSGLV